MTNMLPTIRPLLSFLATTLLALISLNVQPVNAEISVSKYNVPNDYFSSDFKKALNFLENRDFSSLMDEISYLKKRNPRRFPMEKVYLLEGIGFQEQSLHKEAITSFREGLTLRGSNSDLLYLAAESELGLALIPAARESVQESLWFGRFEFIPKERAYYLLGMIEKADMKPEKAIEALKRSLTQNGEFQSARAALGDIYLSNGRKAEAVATLREAISKEKGSNTTLKLNLAKALLLNSNRVANKRDLKEAQNLATEVLQSNDSNIPLNDVRPVYIRSLIENGELTKASQSLALSLKRDPNNPELQKLTEQIRLESEAVKSNIGQDATLLPK